jgi:CRP/FNR family transcriptional regulator, anaerobic regulatory protein
MNIHQQIKAVSGLSPQITQKIGEFFQRDDYPKGHFLYRQGEICQHIYYIEKGLARVYYFTESGKEITQWFFAENNFLTAVDSFYHHKPTSVYCELLEDSVIYSIKYSEMEAMLDENHEMARFAFHTVYELARMLSSYISAMKFQSAEERYNALMKEYPRIFQRAKLGHIASFLGITQETLSRIRAGK